MKDDWLAFWYTLSWQFWLMMFVATFGHWRYARFKVTIFDRKLGRLLVKAMVARAMQTLIDRGDFEDA